MLVSGLHPAAKLMLLTSWLPETARGTRDLDLLGFGDDNEQRILGIFREVMAIAGEDGIAFDFDALQVGPIREELEYPDAADLIAGIRMMGLRVSDMRLGDVALRMASVSGRTPVFAVTPLVATAGYALCLKEPPDPPQSTPGE